MQHWPRFCHTRSKLWHNGCGNGSISKIETISKIQSYNIIYRLVSVSHTNYVATWRIFCTSAGISSIFLFLIESDRFSWIKSPYPSWHRRTIHSLTRSTAFHFLVPTKSVWSHCRHFLHLCAYFVCFNITYLDFEAELCMLLFLRIGN